MSDPFENLMHLRTAIYEAGFRHLAAALDDVMAAARLSVAADTSLEVASRDALQRADDVEAMQELLVLVLDAVLALPGVVSG